MVDASDVSGKDARPEAGRLAIPIFGVSSDEMRAYLLGLGGSCKHGQSDGTAHAKSEFFIELLCAVFGLNM